MLHAISFAEIYSAIETFNAAGLNPHGPNVAVSNEWPLTAVIEVGHPQLPRLELIYGHPPSTPDGQPIEGFVTFFNAVHVTTRARAGHGLPRCYRYAPHSKQVTEARLLVTPQMDPAYFAAGHKSAHEWLEAFGAVRKPLVIDDGFLRKVPQSDRLPLVPPLRMELVPEACWNINLCQKLPGRDWQKLRKIILSAYAGECEVCCLRPEGRARALDVHERWDYNERTGVQRLVRLSPLCFTCHGCTHFQRSLAVGRRDEVVPHMMDINGWTFEQLVAHQEASIADWHRRNEIKWRLDVSYIEELGVPIPAALTERRPQRAASGRKA